MKVFVSSTARDLADHRQAAIRSLRRLGHEVVAMEEFTAATNYPLDRVLSLVRECDAYVLLVAWRYGYIPEIDVSITEREYHAARENPKRPVLVFLLSEDAPWPPQFMDGFDPLTTVPISRVRQFRAMLMREHIVSFFERPDELEALVSAAVTQSRLSRGVLINRLSTSDPVQGGAVAPDSSATGGMVAAVLAAESNRVITIDLATDWWSTRLYLLAFLLDRFTVARRILIVDRGRFVGLLPLGTVMRVVASLHPAIRQFQASERARDGSEPDIAREVQAVAERFVTAMKDEFDVRVVVTAANLGRWFEDSIVTSPIRVDDIERASPLDLIRLFDYPGDFVPVIVGQGDEQTELSRSHVIDKPALSLQLARAYVTDLLDESRR